MTEVRGLILGAVLLLGIHTAAAAGEITAGPDNYRAKISSLQPGDTLVLDSGIYTDGLYVVGIRGTSSEWIIIRSSDKDNPAVFEVREGSNTAEFINSSYVAFENLKFDGKGLAFHHAISAKDGSGNLTHHIRIEGCTIVGHGGHQQTVGISTKCPTWGWIIRKNTIIGAGTGIYLGDSNGQHPFVAGIVENNLIIDPEGYCMQIKHQFSRPSVAGMPTTPQVTIIRHNVFIKTDRPSGDGNRPNLLLGAFPASGTGSQDMYEVYGNFFFHNPRESLMQSEGRVSIHDNVFADASGAIHLGDHNLTLRVAEVYNNTIYDCDSGIYLRSTPDQNGSCVGNVIFSGNGINGSGVWDVEKDNIVDTVAAAANYVENPSTVLGEMDFYPLAGQLTGAGLDLSDFTNDTEYDKDFNGTAKGARTYRGAYAGSGTNPGWQLQAALKGLVAAPTPTPSDTTPPTGTLAIAGNPAQTESTTVDLDVAASDDSGTVQSMSFSNNGQTWSPPESYNATKTGWDLADFGGSSEAGNKTIYARFMDEAGNWSTDAEITATIELVGTQPEPEPEPTSTFNLGALGLESILLAFFALAALCVRRPRHSHS